MTEELNKQIDQKIEIIKIEINGLLKEYYNKFKILIHKKTNLPIEYTVEIIVTKLSDEDDYGIILDVLGPNKMEGNFSITFDLYRSNGPILKTKVVPIDLVLKGQTLSDIFLEFEKELIKVLKTEYLN